MAKKIAIIATVFILFGAALTLSRLAVKTFSEMGISQARAATTQAWEYKCIEGVRQDKKSKSFPEQFETQFNALGAQGWEMVSGGGAGNQWRLHVMFCFKRPR